MDNGFIGEIRLLPYNFAPNLWVECAGQPLPVSQYQALFAVIGYKYGGGGQTFYVPDMRDRVAVGAGRGQGLTQYQVGNHGGAESVALNPEEMPQHNHTWIGCRTPATSPDPATGVLANVPATTEFKQHTGSISNPVQMSGASMGISGSSMPHENRQPFLALRYCICWNGQFPPHS